MFFINKWQHLSYTLDRSIAFKNLVKIFFYEREKLMLTFSNTNTAKVSDQKLTIKRQHFCSVCEVFSFKID